MTPQETADALGIANVLDKAAEIIERFGYRPYTFDGATYPTSLDDRQRLKATDCQVCEVGAIALAAGAQHGFPDHWRKDATVRGMVDAAVMELGTTAPEPYRDEILHAPDNDAGWMSGPAEALSDAKRQYDLFAGDTTEARTAAAEDNYAAMTVKVVAHLRNTAIELRDQA